MTTIIALFLTTAFAYIPPSRMILERVSENSGSGVYALEQEVQFSNAQESLFLKENWLIESDQSMSLVVTGTKDLKDQIKMHFVYAGGLRWSLSSKRESQRLSEDFLEKYFHLRTTDRLAAVLLQIKVLPPHALGKKPLPKTVDGFKNEPEDFVRLSKTGGVVNYAYGLPSPVDGIANSGLWIEQDQFYIRKLRLPSQVEISADNYNAYSRGLSLPKIRTIRWGQNTVTIRLISVSGKAPNTSGQFQPSSLNTPVKLDGLNNLPAKDVVTEFYSRFR